jgi:hypothetical protein
MSITMVLISILPFFAHPSALSIPQERGRGKSLWLAEYQTIHKPTAESAMTGMPSRPRFSATFRASLLMVRMLPGLDVEKTSGPCARPSYIDGQCSLAEATNASK